MVELLRSKEAVADPLEGDICAEQGRIAAKRDRVESSLEDTKEKEPFKEDPVKFRILAGKHQVVRLLTQLKKKQGVSDVQLLSDAGVKGLVSGDAVAELKKLSYVEIGTDDYPYAGLAGPTIGG